jgi:ribonuclease BN (tRNA processing enzyme)
MARLTLTVLGAGPAAPNVGGACSGYLLQAGDQANLLIDCGSGVAGRLGAHLAANRVRAIAISHLHPDHYFDLVPLYYILKFGEPRPAGLEPRVPLHVPPGGGAFLRRFGELIANDPGMLDDVFDISEYTAARETTLGGLSVSFHPVQHYIPSHAIRVRGGDDGATLVFSSDAGPCPQLVEAARRADLFLCEASLLDASLERANGRPRGHLSAAEAGAAAREAGVRRLLLTHYVAGRQHEAHHRDAAARTFGGSVELAQEGTTYIVE